MQSEYSVTTKCIFTGESFLKVLRGGIIEENPLKIATGSTS